MLRYVRARLKFRGYAVKRKSSAKNRAEPSGARARSIAIALKSNWQIRNADFLLPDIPRMLSANCRARPAGKTRKNCELEVSLAWADPNVASLLNSETSDLDVTAARVVYRLRNTFVAFCALIINFFASAHLSSMFPGDISREIVQISASPTYQENIRFTVPRSILLFASSRTSWNFQEENSPSYSGCAFVANDIAFPLMTLIRVTPAVKVTEAGR